jgi:hypothetical protein
MIWIFGDSFAASSNNSSWTSNIGEVANFSSNGSSEYRILKNYYSQKNSIGPSDTVLFVHTSPTRIFLKDSRSITSRQLDSHPFCDIIINDIVEKKETEYIKILESIWDDDYFNDMFDLIVDRLITIPNSIHVTFFETSRNDIIQLNHIWIANPGNTNHMSDYGNRLTTEAINQLLVR